MPRNNSGGGRSNNNQSNNRSNNTGNRSSSAGRNTNAGRNPMGGGRGNSQPQRQGNQGSVANTNRAPRTGGPNGLGFAGDYPNTAGGPWDFGRNPNAPVNGTYVNGAGETRGMSGQDGVRDGLYTNYENNNYKWLGSQSGLGVTMDRYANPTEALNTKIGDRQHDMAGGDWGSYLALIGAQNGQVGLGAVQKAESRGATKDQLDRFFAHSGINLGDAAKAAGYGTNPYAQTGDWGNPAAMNPGSADAGSGENSSGLRNPNKDANHWTNYNYGNKFGGKDIKDLQDSGYTNNQIMKIAQGAYAGGDVRRVNKLNEKIGQLNQNFINPDTYTYTNNKGSSVSNFSFGGAKPPKRAFSWNGFGNGMTIFERPNSFGQYQPRGGSTATAQWSLPTSLMNGFSPIASSGQTETGGGSPSGSGGYDGSTASGGGGGTAEPVVPTTPGVNQSGFGADIPSFAPGWKSRKGIRAKSGRGAQGFASMRIAPSYASGVGSNLG